MRIDAHHHFWHYVAAEYDWMSDAMSAIQRDFLPEDLQAELSDVGIDGTVVVQARQTETETRWLLSLAERYTVIKGVVGWVDLRAPGLRKRLEGYRGETKLKGFRHVLEGESTPGYMLDPAFVAGLRTLNELGYSYDILIRSNQLPEAIELVQRLPAMRLIVDHLAKPDIQHRAWDDWCDGLTQLASFANVHCKVSGMVTEADWSAWRAEDFEPYLEHVFRVFGPQRILFGSDWPVCRLAGQYGAVYRLVQDFVRRRYPNDEAAVFGDNAAAFYRL